MIGDQKRPLNNSVQLNNNSNAPIDVLHIDPLMYVFHQLPSTSFVGSNAIQSVCKHWNKTLKLNGSWQRKKSPNALISCNLEEMLNLFQSGEAFRLFSFSEIIEILSLHPVFTNNWRQLDAQDLLTEEESEALNIQNSDIENKDIPFFTVNTKQWVDGILNNVALHLPANITAENLQTLATSSYHIALYVLANFETYDEQLTDTILTALGESHPLVAKRIFEIPELYERLDGEHFVSLCTNGQAALISFVLASPALKELCTDEDLAELHRMAILCKSLQDFSITYGAKIDSCNDEPKGKCLRF